MMNEIMEKKAHEINPYQREPGQRAITVDQPPFLVRLLPRYATPVSLDANLWRAIVRRQPICIICRDTLISFVQGTPWQIQAIDPNDNETYRDEIDTYTKMFKEAGGLDFGMFLDLLCQDILDTPFGGAVEMGRMNDDPDGDVMWFQHIDAATLFPTFDPRFPVAQKVPWDVTKIIKFPPHAINRTYLTPRPEIGRKGWGMPPPEKIYLAVELLARGDNYYANLLLDTPEAGVLDLMDMKKESALEWLASFKIMFTGLDPMKVPVLYEHTTPARFLPFGRPPTELIFNEITFKYAQIAAAGYGLKTSDIGLSREEARTLAGVIRAERQTRRTGFAMLVTKLKTFFDRMLPDFLEFEWLDQDDESMIARGRARLSNAQAFAEMKEQSILTVSEIRAQIAADGLMSINIDPDNPELTTADVVDDLGPQRTQFLQKKVPVSAGGRGELAPVSKKSLDDVDLEFERIIESATRPKLRRLARQTLTAFYSDLEKAIEGIDLDEFGALSEVMVSLAFENESPQVPKSMIRAAIKKKNLLNSSLKGEPWYKLERQLMIDTISGSMLDAYRIGSGAALTAVEELRYELEIDKKHDFELPEANFSSWVSKELTNTNNWIKWLIKSLSMASVFSALSGDDIGAMLIEGASIDDIMMNEEFIFAVRGEFLDGFADALRAKASQLRNLASSTAFNLGAEAVAKYFGLGKENYTIVQNTIILDSRNVRKAELVKV